MIFRHKQTPFLHRITPANSALILIDYLTGFEPGLRTMALDEYQKNLTALIKLGQLFQLPIVVLGDEGGFRGEFMQPVKEFLADVKPIGRHSPSAWLVREFRDTLERLGRQNLIVAGISLDNCTLLNTLDLLRAGYTVHVVCDVSGTTDTLVETAAMLRMTQAGAIMTSWVSLASELMVDWESPEGNGVGGLYAEYSLWSGK
jgi:nicotinamidase-related amidase